MADWNREVAPKMLKIINMLKRSPLQPTEKTDIKKSVEPLFTRSPKVLPGSHSGVQVMMEDELITNFNLQEWQSLRREFSQLYF